MFGWFARKIAGFAVSSFGGWPVIIGAGVAVLAIGGYIGWMHLRLAWAEKDLVEATANVETLKRDVKEVVGVNQSLAEEIAATWEREAKKTADLASVRAENRSLQSRIDRDRREARNEPIPAGQESCPAVRGDLRSFALGLLGPGPAEAIGGDQGRHPGGAAGPKPPR